MHEHQGGVGANRPTDRRNAENEDLGDELHRQRVERATSWWDVSSFVEKSFKIVEVRVIGVELDDGGRCGENGRKVVLRTAPFEETNEGESVSKTRKISSRFEAEFDASWPFEDKRQFVLLGARMSLGPCSELGRTSFMIASRVLTRSVSTPGTEIETGVFWFRL